MTKDTNQDFVNQVLAKQTGNSNTASPRLFGVEPIPSKDSLPKLFTPPPVNNVIPEANYNSPTGGFALKSLNPKVAETANRSSLDGLTSQDGIEKQTQLNMAIKGSLERNDGIPVENKLNAAKTALQIGVQPNTTGQLYKEKVFPNVPESRINESIDKKIVQDDAKANILTNMGYDPLKKTFDDVMNSESKDFYDIIKDAWSTVLPDFVVNNPIVKGREKLDELGKQAFEDVANYLTQKTTGSQNSSFKDVVKYLSYTPVDPEAEIDHRNLIKTVFGKSLMSDKVQAMVNWDKEYRAKYGDHGYLKLAAFMAKEVTVDAVALSLALRSPKMAAALLPESVGGHITSNIMTRLVKCLGRNAVMGIAGTGVQESMDSYLGFPTNTTNELVGRIAGTFVGEGIGHLLAKTGKGIVGAGYKAINSGAKLVGKNGEPVATVGENVLEEAVNGITPTVKDLIPTDINIAIPSIGQEISDTIGTVSTTIPVRDIGSQLKTAMQSDKAGTLGHIFDMTDSEITAATLSRTPTMKEQVLLHGVGNRLIGEKVARQTNVDKTLDYYFNNSLKTISMREGRYTGDNSLFHVKSMFRDPRDTIGVTADNMYDVTAREHMKRNALLQAQKVAFKGLKAPVTEHILNIRDMHGNIAAKDPNFIVTQTTLEAEGLSAAEQDAYWAAGKITDFSAILEEMTAMKNAAQAGLKSLHGRRQVQVLKHLDGEEQGAVMVRDVKGGEPFAVHNSELSDVTQVMGYRKYAMPRRYAKANYLAGSIDTATGKVDVHTVSEYKSEIEDFVTKLDLEHKGTGKAAFYFKAATGESSMNFGLGSNSASALDVLDDAGIQAMKEALKKGGRPDITDEELAGIRLGFDNVTFGSLTSQKVAGARGAGLKTVTGEAAAYKPHSEALTQHLMEVAALETKDFRLNAITKFRNEFKEVLADPTGNWDQPIVHVLGKKELAEKAISVQDFIRRSIFNETSYGKGYRQSIDGWVERQRASGDVRKRMIDGIATTPYLNTLFKQTRDGTAFVKKIDSFIVFAGNFSSFITQVATALPILIGSKVVTNPIALTKGLMTWTSMLAIKAGAGKAMPKEVHEALRALRKSGIISDVSLEEEGFKTFGQSSTLYNKGMALVGAGEATQKGAIWTVIREEYKGLAKKGELQGITKSLTATDIDSPEFIQVVSEKAKQLHLDMTSSGKIGLTSGAGSLIFRWMAPVIKTHTLFFSKDLTPREKFGAGLGFLAFYGLPAVPYMGTTLFMADKGGEWTSGMDEVDDYTIATDMTNNAAKLLIDEIGDLAGATKEQKDFFINTTKKGGIATLTGNDISLYQRMALNLFSTHTVNNSVSDPLEYLATYAILKKAVGSASNIAEMLHNLYTASTITPEEAAKAGEPMPSDRQKQIELRKFIGEVADELGNTVPGIGRMVDVLNNNPETRRYLKPDTENLPSTGFITRTGKRIETGENVNTRQQMLLLFGIVPAPVQANREILKGQYDRVAILKDMQDTWIGRYKNANTDIAKVRVQREAQQAADEAEQVLMATYQGALSIATGSSDDKTKYNRGTLRKQWFNAFHKIDQEALSGNVTTSRGETTGE